MSRIRRRESGLKMRIPQALIPDSLNWPPQVRPPRLETHFPAGCGIAATARVSITKY
jgi:hypothetical protein